MDAYISKEQVLRLIDGVEFDADDDYYVDDILNYLLMEVEAMPPADVRPVVRGQRLEDEDGWPVCGCCGGSLDNDEQYCPFCGAKMEEE